MCKNYFINKTNQEIQDKQGISGHEHIVSNNWPTTKETQGQLLNELTREHGHGNT